MQRAAACRHPSAGSASEDARPHKDLVGARVASLDELDEPGAGRARQLKRDSLGKPPRRSLVRAGRDRPNSSDHTDPAADRGRVRPSATAGALLQATTSLTSSSLDQLGRDLMGEARHLCVVPRPVRVTSRVTEVDQIFGGQQVDHRARHRDAPETAVEHPDRSPVHVAES